MYIFVEKSVKHFSKRLLRSACRIEPFLRGIRFYQDINIVPCRRIRMIILSRVYKGAAVNKEKEIIRANKGRINSSILGLPCYREIYRNGVTGNGVWLNGRGLFKICCSRELLDGHESYVTPRAMHSSICFGVKRRKDKTKWGKNGKTTIVPCSVWAKFKFVS